MRTSRVALIALAALVISSCGDDSPTTAPGTGFTPVGCTADYQSVRAAANALFTGRPADLQYVNSALERINVFVSAGNQSDAARRGRELVQYVQQRALDIHAVPALVDALVNGILCWAGTSDSSFVVYPADTTQTLTSNDGNAGVQLPPNVVNSPAVITITVVDDHLITEHDTKLDRYPRSVLVTSSVQIPNSVVGVCMTNIPASVFPHLRLGHVTSEGFKVEPPAPVDFLNCPTTGGATRGGIRGALHSLARFLLPKTAYARQEDVGFSGGVGGTAGEYSPFEPVDTDVGFSGGVGGTAGEYIRGSGRANTVAGGECTAMEAPVNGALEPECRPRIEVKTHNGTVLTNVPVTWTITAGGGKAAAENPATRVCSTFGSVATNTTNANGKAGICWTMGPAAGSNEVVATVAIGGDVPPGVSFTPSSLTFNATALSVTPPVTATGETVAYDGLDHTGSGSCANGQTPVLSYGGGVVPHNVGTYTLTVTCGAQSATATITINPATPHISITCTAPVTYSGAAHTPCVASVTAPGLNQAVTPSYSSNVNAGTANVLASFAASGNYGAATGTATFQIVPASSTTTLSCTPLLAYNGTGRSPCTASVSGAGGLSQQVFAVYSPDDVKNAGTYGATASFAGDANHTPSQAASSFIITPIAATATAGSGTLTVGAPLSTLPCTITVLPVDASQVTCTTSVVGGLQPGSNVTVPALNPSSPVNYTVSSVSGSVTALFARVQCFGAPVSATPPATSASIPVGSQITIGCRFQDANGNPATNASGSLRIDNIGAAGTSVPVNVFLQSNAFTASGDLYSNTVNTTGFAAGRYYRVIAIWNDGTATVGYFYLN